MTYNINEIFYSLQGEGFFTGTPSIFVRFSGCNLTCNFCDTNHAPHRKMTGEMIVEEVNKYPAKHVVITGGEPSLQLTAELVDALHGIGKFVAVETNGTHQLPKNVDWITLSPKQSFEGERGRPTLTHCHELKLVFDGHPQELFDDIEAQYRFMQPCFVEEDEERKRIIRATVGFCMEHPEWRLSMQTHRILNIQ